MIYQRKTLPQVTVTSITENTVDEHGNRLAGIVVYTNEFGSKGVMCYDDFMNMYDVVEDYCCMRKEMMGECDCEEGLL